jgi:hypothetical protein
VSVHQEITYEWRCDRCGYVDTVNDHEDRTMPLRWAKAECSGDATYTGDLCPGCVADFERFLNNRPVEVQKLGDEYRYPERVA